MAFLLTYFFLLPDNFQTAEYLLKHGLVDLVVPRPLLKQALAEMLTFYQEAPLRKPGKIPHGVAGPLSQTQAVNLTSQWSKGELTKGSRLQSVLNFLSLPDQGPDRQLFDMSPGTYYADRLFTRLVKCASNTGSAWWTSEDTNKVQMTNFQDQITTTT